MVDFEQLIKKYEDNLSKYQYVKDAVIFLIKTLQVYQDNKNLFISFNGGKDATVVLYLSYMAIHKIEYNVKHHHIIYNILNKTRLTKQYEEKGEIFGIKQLRSVYFEEPDPFQEATDFKDRIKQELNLDEIVVERDFKKSLKFLVNSYNLQAVIMGSRRVDPYCEHLERISPSDTDKGYPAFLRVNPILDWTYEQIWEFLIDFNIPYCSLYEKGFTYLGNSKNTLQNHHSFSTDGTILPAWKLSGAVEQNSRIISNNNNNNNHVKQQQQQQQQQQNGQVDQNDQQQQQQQQYDIEEDRILCIFGPMDKLENLRQYLKNKRYHRMMTFNTDNNRLDIDNCFTQIKVILDKDQQTKLDILICNNYNQAQLIKSKLESFHIAIQDVDYI